MNKTIVKCPSCGQKMKITFKPAKYRCPNCKSIYKLTLPVAFYLRIKGIVEGAVSTLKDGIWNVKKKYRDAKATAQYIHNVKKNMKGNPNWSNYHKENNEMKKAQKANVFKDIFKKKK